MQISKENSSHLKKRILVQDRDGFLFQPAGILKYVEDLKQEANKDIELKDFFEMACSMFSGLLNRITCFFPSKPSPVHIRNLSIAHSA